MKKGIEKEYYEKVGRRYIKKQYWDFPSIPTDGLWLVNSNWGGRGVCARLEEVHKLNIKTLGMLMQYKEECAKMLMEFEDNPPKIKTLKGEEIRYIPSAMQKVEAIFKFLAEKAK